MTGKTPFTARAHKRACRFSNPCTSNKRVRPRSAAPVQGGRPPEISALRSGPVRQVLQIPCKAPPYSADEDRKLETRKPDEFFLLWLFLWPVCRAEPGESRSTPACEQEREEEAGKRKAGTSSKNPVLPLVRGNRAAKSHHSELSPLFDFLNSQKTKQIEHRVKRAPEASRFIALSSRSSLRLIHPLRLASGRVPFSVQQFALPLPPSHRYLPLKNESDNFIYFILMIIFG